MTIINQIMAICDDPCDAARYRHHLETLKPHELAAHLDALQQSEQRHAGRWLYERQMRPTTATDINRALTRSVPTT